MLLSSIERGIKNQVLCWSYLWSQWSRPGCFETYFQAISLIWVIPTWIFFFRRKCLTQVSLLCTCRFSWHQAFDVMPLILPNWGLIASCLLFSIIVIRKISQMSMWKDSLCGAEPKKANTIHGDSPREMFSFYVSRRCFTESCLTGEEDNRKGVTNTWKTVVSTWQ